MQSASFGSYNPAMSTYPGLSLMQQNAFYQAQRQQMAMGMNPSFNNMGMTNMSQQQRNYFNNVGSGMQNGYGSGNNRGRGEDVVEEEVEVEVEVEEERYIIII